LDERRFWFMLCCRRVKRAGAEGILKKAFAADYVGMAPPRQAAEEPEPRPLMLERIKQALVTSRLTLAGDTAGDNPYDSRPGRDPGSVWGNRSR
jgi:hypothetical protein